MTDRLPNEQRPQQETDRYFLLNPWLWAALIFLVALLPRIIGLNVFLTADEDDQLQFAVRFQEAISRRAWSEVLVIGYPGVPTMSLGALGIWLQDQTAFINHLSFVNAPFYKPISPLPEPDTGAKSPGLHAIYLAHVAKPAPPLRPKSEAIVASPLLYVAAIRLTLGMLFALLLTFIFVALNQLIPQPMALLATLLFVFDPFLLAHSRVIHVDASLAHFMFAGFLAFIIYLERGHWFWLLASGVMGALAVLSKTPGVLLAPILVATGLCYLWLTTDSDAMRKRSGRVRLKRLIGALSAWGGIAAVAFFLFWPSMWARPLYAINRIIGNVFSVMEFESHPTSGVFWGITNSDRSPFYYLLTMPFHLTPLTLLGLIATIALLILGFRDYRRQQPSFAAQHLPLLVSLMAFVILFVGPVSYVSRRADRYVLPAHFALDLLAMFGLWFAAMGLVRWWRSRPTQVDQITDPTKLTIGLVTVAILVQSFFVIRHHPYYLTYFNPLLGGGQAALYMINVGWGEGLDQAAHYLNQQEKAANKNVAAWYSWQFAPYFVGQSIDLASNEPAYIADYTVFYVNQVQRGFPSREILDYFEDRVPEKVIHLQGIDYAWIYPGPIFDYRKPALEQPLNLRLNEALQLANIELPETAANGSQLPVTLYWHTLQPLPDNLNVSLRLTDEQGRIWSQTDRFPIGGLVRTGRWQPGQYIRDEYLLTLEPDLPPGFYQFDILMYDFETGAVFAEANQVGNLQAISHPLEQATEVIGQTWPDATQANLAPALNLISHTPLPLRLKPAQREAIKLTWHAPEQPPQNYQVTLIGQSATGETVTLANKQIGPNHFPTSQWVANQLLSDYVTLAFPADSEPGLYDMIIQVADGPEFKLGQSTVLALDRLHDLPAGVTPLQANFGDDIILVGYRLLQQDDRLNLDLYWSAITQPDADFKVFVHLSDAAGQIISQQDQVPQGGERPTSTWLPLEFVADSYSLPVTPEVKTIWLGLYNPQTGGRLPVVSQASPVSDNRLEIPLSSP